MSTLDPLLISLVIHIPAVTIWVGLALWDAFLSLTPGLDQSQRARLIARTGMLTLLLILVIMVTGVYQTIDNPFREIKSYSDLSGLRADTTYGMALFVKHAFVIVTFILSLIVRFYLAPRALNVYSADGGAAVATQTRVLTSATLINLAVCMLALVAASRMTIELH